MYNFVLRGGILKRLISLMLCFLIIFLTCGCSGSDSASSTVRIVMNYCPDNLDPQLAETDETLAIVRNCYEGLFRLDDGKLKKAACSDYIVSDDGLEWVFTLRDAKWSDGKKVTANDFIFGLHRALAPETVAPNAQLLSCIKGASDALVGKASPTTAGIRAEGKDKLVITLEKPEADLPEILTRAMCMPCRKDVFVKAGGRYGMSSELMVSNGPFRVSSVSTSIQIVANEHYNGKFTPKVARAVFTYGTTDSERINSINSDIANMAVISSASLDEADAADLDVTRFDDTAWAVIINPSEKVVGDKKVSAALKKAVSSATYEDAMPSGYLTFGGVIADALMVENKPYEQFAKKRNPLLGDKKASKELIDALKQHNGKLPALTMIYPADSQLKPVAARLAQYWQQELGAVINIEAVSADTLNSRTGSGDYQLALCPITSNDGTAVNAVRAFVGDDERSEFGFVVDGLSSLVGLSGSVTAQSISKAEDILMNQPNIIPIAISGRCYAYSGELKNIRLDMLQGQIALY